ncbi:hypothetical protein ACFLZ2_05615 [Candidatus Margulisiibacteriota bacterium]
MSEGINLAGAIKTAFINFKDNCISVRDQIAEKANFVGNKPEEVLTRSIDVTKTKDGIQIKDNSKKEEFGDDEAGIKDVIILGGLQKLFTPENAHAQESKIDTTK